MTEREMRDLLASAAESYLGTKHGSAKQREIVDIYNSHKPLARGYKLQYDDPGCSGFVSAMAIKTRLTAIIPTEVGCEPHIRLMKDMDGWVEKDSYVPERGDIALYDWDDDGRGECTGNADHIGIVTKVEGKWFYVVEGNKGASRVVGLRKMPIDGRYIRGFFVPNYAKLATKPSGSRDGIHTGDVVRIISGAKWYTGEAIPEWVLHKTWRVGEVFNSRVVLEKINSPIHVRYLRKVRVQKPKEIVEGSRVRLRRGAKSYDGETLASFVFTRDYTVLEISGNRVVIGTHGEVTAAVRKSDLVAK